MAVTIESVAVVAAKLGRGASGDAVVAWKGWEAFVLSFDRVILVKLRTKTECPDPGGVAFHASSFESAEVRMVDGSVVYDLLRDGEFCQVVAPAPTETFADLAERFAFLRAKVQLEKPLFILNKTLLGFLDPEVPHVEVEAKDGTAFMRQRDIYTGKVSTTQQRAEPGAPNLPALAVRTADLFQLASLGKTLVLAAGRGYFALTDLAGVDAIVGGCVFDGLGEITEIGGGHGRKVGKGNAGVTEVR